MHLKWERDVYAILFYRKLEVKPSILSNQAIITYDSDSKFCGVLNYGGRECLVAYVCVLLLARELAYFSDANVDLNLLKLCTMAKMLMMVRRRRTKCFHYNGYALVTFTYRSVAPNQSTFLITNRMETHQNGAEQKNREWQIDFIFSPAIRRRRDETLGHHWTQCACR